MRSPCRILLISGSLRAGSTNASVLRTARAIAPAGILTTLYEGMAALPHFNPDEDREGEPAFPAVAELRAQIGAADALLICTPEYAGALPGALKNLLEWTVGGASAYRKAIAWINAAGPAAPSGASDAHSSLRNVLRYVGAEIVESACMRVAVTRGDVGAHGLIADVEIRMQIAKVLSELAEHASRDGDERS